MPLLGCDFSKCIPIDSSSCEILKNALCFVHAINEIICGNPMFLGQWFVSGFYVRLNTENIKELPFNS